MSASQKQSAGAAGASPAAVKASSQGLICMWHGLTMSGLCNLIRLRPAVSWKYVPRWVSIAILSIFNSLNCLLERLIYGRRIRQATITHPPVFILGHWRSGTTMLHNLMSMDPQVTFPNLYHCVNPGHFLLTENILAPLTSRFLPATRPMDNVETGWGEPQEEDIALALDCGISPYMMAAFTGRRSVYERFFDPRDMSAQELSRWKASYIRRDPYAVYQSTMHLRRTMLSENSLGPPDFSTSEEDMLYFYEKCIRTYEETKTLIPAGRLHELRFEDMEKDPLEEIRKVYHNLNLPGWERLEPKIQEKLPSLKAYRKNAFRMDRETMRAVYSRLKWVFDLYQYPCQMDDESTAGR
jgi:omega-hydroxy-beta-dihydromenaquinone-9 sulfotransferase